jgi:hypothetical protein
MQLWHSYHKDCTRNHCVVSFCSYEYFSVGCYECTEKWRLKVWITVSRIGITNWTAVCLYSLFIIFSLTSWILATGYWISMRVCVSVPWNRLILENVIMPHLVKKSKWPAIDPSLELNESSPAVALCQRLILLSSNLNLVIPSNRILLYFPTRTLCMSIYIFPWVSHAPSHPIKC